MLMRKANMILQVHHAVCEHSLAQQVVTNYVVVVEGQSMHARLRQTRGRAMICLHGTALSCDAKLCHMIIVLDSIRKGSL